MSPGRASSAPDLPAPHGVGTTARSDRQPLAAAHAALALGLTALVYYPIVDNYFHADDFLHLQNIVNYPFLRWLFTPHGGHLCVLRNALFSLCHVLFGPHPAGYFWVVLATHLANVALLFGVLRALTGSHRLACLGASAWGVCPLAAGSLGWYSVYGHVVATTALLAALFRVARRLEDGRDVSLPEAALWCGLLLAGAASFGVGIGIALVFPVAALLLFGRARLPRPVRVLLACFPAVVVILYVAAQELYGRAYGPRSDWHVTLAVGLGGAWRADVAMLLHLLTVAVLGLVAGFGFTPATYPNARLYGIAALALGLVGVAFALSPPRSRRLLLATGLLSIGGYALIALGRATVYAWFPAARAYDAWMPRYHYAGSVGLTILFCVALAELGRRLGPGPARSETLLLAWLAVTVTLYLRSGWTVDHHASDRRQTERTVSTIRAALDSAPPGTPIYIPNRPFPPALLIERVQANIQAYLEKSSLADGHLPLDAPARSFAGWAAVYTIFFPDDRHAVYFVEPDPAVRRLGPPGSHLAAVLVPPRDEGGTTGGVQR